jgi:hypothetical protein
MPKPVMCITLWQPWGTLIALGAKQFETRSWPTPYRGPLVIHTAKRFDAEQQAWCRKEIFREVLAAAGYHHPAELPLGRAICICDLTDVVATADQRDQVSAQEQRFGDWSAGRFAWKLENVRVFVKPVPVQGMQGLWPWPAALPLPEVRGA